jgi:nucleoside-diphosphate-sugar epimerase
MSKVIVTGGAGFIGSHLAEGLVKQGHTVCVIDNLCTGSQQNLSSIIGDIEFVRADIRDKEAISYAFEGADTIFHQAALRSVPASLENPAIYNDVNINGTYNVLEAARHCGARRVIFASSSSVYGDSTELPQKEENLGTRLSPYAITKAAGEDYCRFFWKTYGLETVSLRYFNVFGPRQDPKSQYAAVIPLFITALLNDRQPTIFGDGKQTRDFTYITNVVNANILAMASETAVGEVINVANGEGVSVNELFEKIRSFLNKDIKPLYAPERKGDVKHTKADVTKQKKLLGLNDTTNFDRGLEQTTEWYNAAYRRQGKGSGDN